MNGSIGYLGRYAMRDQVQLNFVQMTIAQDIFRFTIKLICGLVNKFQIAPLGA
jgi:hypothetical protein